MRIAYLGFGAWGCCLASLLARKGHEVTIWCAKQEAIDKALNSGCHPRLSQFRLPKNLKFSTHLAEAVSHAEIIVESISSAGLRPTLASLRPLLNHPLPLVITSKGIEQGSALTLPEVALEVLGPSMVNQIALLSGPSFAQEVMAGLPTSVVAASDNELLTFTLCELFSTATFRVYPNSDVRGVALGGSLKNIIAIACGIAEGLSLGYGSSAALMTRGLHEMRKLAICCGCRPETLYGLSGMGDICMTCTSPMSRNFRYGHLLASGKSHKETLDLIGMVVEGSYSCISALQLASKHGVAMPITEAVYKIIYEGLPPQYAVDLLMQRSIKEEHL